MEGHEYKEYKGHEGTAGTTPDSFKDILPFSPLVSSVPTLSCPPTSELTPHPVGRTFTAQVTQLEAQESSRGGSGPLVSES